MVGMMKSRSSEVVGQGLRDDLLESKELSYYRLRCENLKSPILALWDIKRVATREA